MQNELRYQAKIHTISEKIKKKNLHLSPQFFFCFVFVENKRQKNNKNMLMEKINNI